MIYGPTFGQEIIDAGLAELPVWWTETELFGRDTLTPEQQNALAAVEVAHDPTAELPPAPDPAAIAADHEARLQTLEVQAGLRQP